MKTIFNHQFLPVTGFALSYFKNNCATKRLLCGAQAGANPFASLFLLLVLLPFAYSAEAGEGTPFSACVFCRVSDTLTEKKVDYLVQLYFSGKNKQELSGLILAALQQMEAKQATTAVARQYTFLSGIKDNAEGAKSACEVLEMIANGIYAIDAAEAILMGIPKPKPDSKASLNAAGALSSLGNLNSTAQNAAAKTWLLSGGKTSAASGGLLNATNKVGDALNTGGQALQVMDQGKQVLKGLGIGFGGGDKACKNVPAKTIALGEHNATTPTASEETQSNAAAETANGLRIVIKNITYNQFSAVATELEKTSGIGAVNSDDWGKNTGTLLIAGGLRTKEVVNKIVQGNPKLSFEIENTTANTADLSVKPKK